MHDPLASAPEAGSSDVRTVQRAFSLLALLAGRNSALTLSQLSRAAGLPIATVSRLLATLLSIGFVERTEERTYRTGAHLARIGLEALQRHKAFRLPDSHLERLVAATGETASLAVRTDENSGVYLRQLPGPRAISRGSWAGKSFTLDTTASGAALLGMLGEHHYAIQRHQEERGGFTAIASPLRDASGTIIGALVLSGPSSRIEDAGIRRLGDFVAERARAASQEICTWD